MVESDESAKVPAGVADGRPLTFAQKLTHLFDTRKNPKTGRKYTNAEVAQATGLAESSVAQLRSGKKPNPTKNTIEALAAHFRVNPDYFFDGYDAEESEKIRASLELIETVADSNVRGLALRANGLSADSLKMIKAVIEQARRLEGLDKAEG